jgi:hypothetical protein
MPVECKEVTNWIEQFSRLKCGTIHLSVANDIPFHKDEDSIYFALTHRILIPVTDNFIWQFILSDGTIETVVPVIGNIYLFNNMIMHNVVSTGDEKRMCILVNMYDTNIEDTILKLDNGSYHS